MIDAYDRLYTMKQNELYNIFYKVDPVGDVIMRYTYKTFSTNEEALSSIKKMAEHINDGNDLNYDYWEMV